MVEKLIDRQKQLLDIGMEKTGYGYVSKGLCVMWYDVIQMTDFHWNNYISQLKIRKEAIESQIERNKPNIDLQNAEKYISTLQAIEQPIFKSNELNETFSAAHSHIQDIIYWLQKEIKHEQST